MCQSYRVIVVWGIMLLIGVITPLSGQVAKTKLEPPKEHSGFFALAFSPDGKTIAGGTGQGAVETSAGKMRPFGGEVILWDAQTGKLKKTLGKQGASVTWLAYSRDGKMLASASKDNGIVKFWDMQTGKLKQTLTVKNKPGALDGLLPFPTLSPDSMVLVALVTKVTKGKDWTHWEPQQMIVWDAKTDKVRWTVPNSNVHQVAFSPDGKVLAGYVYQETLNIEKGESTVTNPRIVLWDVQTGQVIRTIKRENYYGAITFLPDNKTMAVLKSDETELWDPQTGKLKSEVKFNLHTPSHTLAFSPDGKTLAYAYMWSKGVAGNKDWTMGDKVELWDLQTGKLKGSLTFQYPHGLEKECAFSPDLKRLACVQDFKPIVLDLSGLK